VLFFFGLGAHLELFWDAPLAAPFLGRLASFSRLILFNRRGTGASGSVPGRAVPTWEDGSDDVLAVLDAAESEQASIIATVDAGPIAILFAAMHPERVSSLVLLTTTARYLAAPDYPAGMSAEAVDAFVAMIERLWGTPELLRMANPSMAEDSQFLEFGAKWFRASSTPRAAAAQLAYMMRSLDVRPVLPQIQSPTLVLHVQESALYPIEHGRYLAAKIPGARLVQLPGGDTGITPANYVVADEVAEFLTGRRPEPELDRVLTTVMHSDIAGSTALAAKLGDQRWRQLLDAHDRLVQQELARFRGRKINSAGDGFLATFDGPARATRCAQSLQRVASTLGLELRIGVHTGECETRGSELAGLAVHIAARAGALANPGGIVVTSTVHDLLVGSGIQLGQGEVRHLRGVPGEWQLFQVDD
jgi:class 3 adenylate cyclase